MPIRCWIHHSCNRYLERQSGATSLGHYSAYLSQWFERPSGSHVLRVPAARAACRAKIWSGNYLGFDRIYSSRHVAHHGGFWPFSTPVLGRELWLRLGYDFRLHVPSMSASSLRHLHANGFKKDRVGRVVVDGMLPHSHHYCYY